MIANWTDGVLIMVDLAKSSHHGVGEALKQLNAVHATPIGFVVNRDRSTVGGRYGYYEQESGSGASHAEARRGNGAGEPLAGQGAEQKS